MMWRFLLLLFVPVAWGQEVNILQLPTSTSPLFVGEIATFSTTVMSVPVPTITWRQQIFIPGTPLVSEDVVPDGENTNITIQTLDNTTWRSVLSLRVPERPGVQFERYFITVDNGVDTFAISENDAPLLIRAEVPQDCGTIINITSSSDPEVFPEDIARTCFRCQFGSPPTSDPMTTWMLNGSVISPSQGVVVDGVLVVFDPVEAIGISAPVPIVCVSSAAENLTISAQALVLVPPGVADVTVNEGDTLTIRCESDASTRITSFRWTGPDGANVSNVRTLEIPNIQRDQSGVYTCFITNFQGNTISGSGTVTVQSLRNVTASPQSQDVNIEEVPTITLNCSVDTNQPADTTIQWTSDVRSGVLVNGTGTFLELDLITANLADEEVFTCTATLGDMTESDNATVIAYSSVNITEQPVSTALLVGETASFSCVAVSRPAPTITWFRMESGPVDVQLIDGVENISIVPVTTDNNTTSSDLSVPVRGTEDFTQYFCVAENGFDNQTSDRVELIAAVLQSVTASPQSQDVNIEEVPTITLNCSVDTNRPVDTTIQWTSNVRSGVLANGTGTFLELDLITADLADEEVFTCIATLGDMTESDNATVIAYTFVNITEQPVSTTLLVGETASFSCEAVSRPAPTITWFRVESGPVDVQLIDGVENISIATATDNNTTSSDLSVPVRGTEDFTQYFCVAENGFDNQTSDRVELIAAVLQSVTASPQSQDVNIEEVPTITLNCSVDTNRPADTTIQWTSNVRSGVLANGTGTFLELDLITADLADEEVFTCTATLGDMTASDNATVNAYTFVNITQQPVSTAPLLVDETASFSCVAVSRPAPTITWFRVESGSVDVQLIDGVENISIVPVTTDNNTTSSDLSVPVLGTEDFTQYFCVAENGFVNQTSDRVELIAAVLQNVTASPQSQDVNIEEVPTITLNCSVDTNRPADTTIQWTSNVRSGVLANGTGTFLDLDLDTADLADEEVFTCTATLGDMTESDNATVNAYTFVNITEQPVSTVPLLVGETASFSCEAVSRPAPTITWFRVESGPVDVQLIDGVENISIATATDNNTTSSDLSVPVLGTEDFTQYFCVADNGFDNQTSDRVELIAAVSPTFLVDPESVTLVSGEVASFTCTAIGPPPPEITWEDGAGNNVTDNDMFNITQVSDGANVSSILEFVADLEENQTQYRCVAENRVNRTESELATVIIAGPPGSPGPVTVGNIGPRGATVSWALPFSLIPITQYQITIRNDSDVILIDQILQSGDDGFLERQLIVVDALRPFTAHVAMVVATNRAGVGVAAASPTFATLEDAPEAPPTAVATSAPLARQILVSWNPPPLEFQNGVITLFTVQFQNLLAPNSAPQEVFTSMPQFTLTNLEPGVMYNISVAANTTVGRGPFSGGVLQSTIPLPPPFPAPPVTTDTSTSTFTFTIPSPPGNFSHFWIIILRLGSTSSLPQSPTILFPTNASFVFSSINSVPPVGSPYVAAEISAGSLPETFSAGDSASTVGINDNDIYVNVPLPDETRYTAFVWGFAPSVPGSQNARRRRQTAPPRQYSSFSSSNFVSPVTTQSQVPQDCGTIIDITSSSDPEVFPEDIARTCFRCQFGSPPTSDPMTTWMLNGSVISPSQGVVVDGVLVVFDPVEAIGISAPVPIVCVSSAAENLTISAQALVLVPPGVADVTVNEGDTLTIRCESDASTRITSFRWTGPDGANVSNVRTLEIPNIQRDQSGVYTCFITNFQGNTISGSGTVTVQSGLSGGAIAGIVVGIILATILVGAIVILLLLVFGLKRKPNWGPPPSRKGSVRLRDFRETAPRAKAVSELQDLNPDDVRLPVSVEDFEGHLKKMHANTDHLFSEEYEIIQIKSPSLPHIQCSMPYNVNKNRYANINCFDDSRVHLSKFVGVDGSDYINANYINGYQQKQAYVATQGPLPNTTHDFWRMVWEFRSCCIIMLTNLVEKSRAKCHQYWPEAGSVSFGELTVTIIDTQELAYYTVRTFRMNRGNDRREVKQFHYTGWPDFGVPDHPHPVISFIRRISNFKRTTDGPDIIHCSAGVGRTGTLIAIQTTMAMMSEEGKVDIFNFVLGMRTQRNYMVQTERQYIFTHDAVMELLRIGDTEVPIQNLRRKYKELQAQNPESELSGLEEEYLQIKELSVIDKTQFTSAKMTVNLGKNRSPDILPYDDYRVRLLMHPGVSGSDYINASYIDGYQQRQQYIVTQGPMKHTMDDFWRMIWEHRVCAILMMCQLEEKGKEQCVRYWPSDKIRQHGDLFVELTQEQEFTSYTMREFSITNTKLNESRMIKHYQYGDWSEDQAPVNAAGIIDLIGVLQKTQHMGGGGPIVVHDSTPIGRTGAFCVLSNVLEQLKVEGIVDLFFNVHTLRQQQAGIVSTIEEYKFCYTAVLEFLDSFDHYANFN